MKEFIKNKYNILIPIFLIIVLLIALILYFREYKENRYANTTKEEVYQYFSGIKLEYTANVSRNKKEAILKYEPISETVNLDNIPIYIKDKKEIIFPKEMSIFLILKDKQYQISPLSNLYVKDDLTYLRYRRVNKDIDYAFYYDGNNLYFFPDSVTINIDNKEVAKLSPLSYINCSYNNYLEYYDYESDTFKSIALGNNEKVTVSNNYLNVDVTSDKVIYKDSFSLLNNDFTYLNKYEEIKEV